MTVKQFKFCSTIKPSQGLTVTNYIKYFVSPYSPISSYSLSNLAEWRLWAAMYDRFRVTKVHFTIKPRIDNINQMAVTGSASNQTNDSSGVYYVTWDRDGPAPSNVTQLKRYRSTRFYSQTKGCSHSYSVRWPKGFWLDTLADASPSTANSNYPMSQQIGLGGGMTIYGENITEKSGQFVNYIWADIEVTYTCAFQTYNPRSITVDEFGSVKLRLENEADDEDRAILQLSTEQVTGETPPDE